MRLIDADKILERLINIKHPNYNTTPIEYAYNMGVDNAIWVIESELKR